MNKSDKYTINRHACLTSDHTDTKTEEKVQPSRKDTNGRCITKINDSSMNSTSITTIGDNNEHCTINNLTASHEFNEFKTAIPMISVLESAGKDIIQTDNLSYMGAELTLQSNDNDPRMRKTIYKLYMAMSGNDLTRLGQLIDEKLSNFFDILFISEVNNCKFTLHYILDRFDSCIPHLSGLIRDTMKDVSQPKISEQLCFLRVFLDRSFCDLKNSCDSQLNIKELIIVLTNKIPHKKRAGFWLALSQCYFGKSMSDFTHKDVEDNIHWFSINTLKQIFCQGGTVRYFTELLGVFLPEPYQSQHPLLIMDEWVKNNYQSLFRNHIGTDQLQMHYSEENNSDICVTASGMESYFFTHQPDVNDRSYMKQPMTLCHEDPRMRRTIIKLALSQGLRDIPYFHWLLWKDDSMENSSSITQMVEYRQFERHVSLNDLIRISERTRKFSSWKSIIYKESKDVTQPCSTLCPELLSILPKKLNELRGALPLEIRSMLYNVFEDIVQYQSFELFYMRTLFYYSQESGEEFPNPNKEEMKEYGESYMHRIFFDKIVGSINAKDMPLSALVEPLKLAGLEVTVNTIEQWAKTNETAFSTML